MKGIGDTLAFLLFVALLAFVVLSAVFCSGCANPHMEIVETDVDLGDFQFVVSRHEEACRVAGFDRFVFHAVEQNCGSSKFTVRTTAERPGEYDLLCRENDALLKKIEDRGKKR